MKVIIRKDTGRMEPWTYDIKPRQTTLDLKKIIRETQGVQPERQTLFHTSIEIKSDMMIEMEDHLIFDDYFMGQETIELLFVLEKRNWKNHKVTLEIQNLDIPNSSKQLIPGLLKKLPSVAKPSKLNLFAKDPVKIDKKKEAPENALRLKVLMNKQTQKRQIETGEWIQKFLEDFRTLIFMHGKVEIPAVNQTDLEKLVTPMNEKDKIFFLIEEYEKELSLEKPLLFPCFERKLQDVDEEVQKEIFDLFQDTLGEQIGDFKNKQKIVLDIARKLDKFGWKEIDELQEEIKKDTVYPFLKVLRKYAKLGGTFRGLTKCLEACLRDDSITKNLGKEAEQKLQDLVLYIKDVTFDVFQKWISPYIPKEQKPHIDAYQDFIRKSQCGWSPKEILAGNTRSWRQIKDDAEDGDQLWMWRKGSWILQYAHVGIITGDKLVHVSNNGLSPIIKEDNVEDVVCDSECFLVKCTPPPKIKGSIRKRAEACKGLQFTYSVGSGNCESFANAITYGIFTTDNSTIQGKKHCIMDNFMRTFNILTSGMSFKKQDQNLLSKIAKRLSEHGFEDEDVVSQLLALQVE